MSNLTEGPITLLDDKGSPLSHVTVGHQQRAVVGGSGVKDLAAVKVTGFPGLDVFDCGPGTIGAEETGVVIVATPVGAGVLLRGEFGGSGSVTIELPGTGLPAVTQTVTVNGINLFEIATTLNGSKVSFTSDRAITGTGLDTQAAIHPLWSIRTAPSLDFVSYTPGDEISINEDTTEIVVRANYISRLADGGITDVGRELLWTPTAPPAAPLAGAGPVPLFATEGPEVGDCGPSFPPWRRGRG